MGVVDLARMTFMAGDEFALALSRLATQSDEIAKKAILKGMDNETIKDLTDLTIEEIETIRNIM